VHQVSQRWANSHTGTQLAEQRAMDRATERRPIDVRGMLPMALVLALGHGCADTGAQEGVAALSSMSADAAFDAGQEGGWLAEAGWYGGDAALSGISFCTPRSDAVGPDAGACGCRGEGIPLPLECRCPAPDCPVSLQAEITYLCGSGKSRHAVRGCGKIMLSAGYTLSGTQYVFELDSGTLQGAYAFGDLPFGPCCMHSTTYGEPPPSSSGWSPNCSQVEHCRLCGVGPEPPCF
jgi:hypothetical protein